MAAKAGTAYVDIKGDFTSLNKQVSAALGPLTSKFGKLGTAGAVGLAGIAAGGIAAGKALYEIGEQFDTASDIITTKTGATGKRLRGLNNDFKAVVKGVPADFETAAEAVGGLSQRLDITGKPLQRLSKQVLQLSKVTGEDLATEIPAVTRLFGDWSIKTRDQSGTLDKLFRLTQKTGIGFSDLSELMVQFGSPLRQLGFSFDESAAMFAKFEKEGVNLQTLLPGLRFALKNIALPTDDLSALFDKLGVHTKNTHTALIEIFDALSSKNVSAADRTLLASSVFGGRAWADMKAAVEEGRFSFNQLIGDMEHGTDTISKAEKRTRDFSENWQVFKNRVMVALEPLSARVFKSLNKTFAQIGRVITDPKLSASDKFGKLADMAGDAIADAIPAVVERMGNLAPKVAVAFVKGFAQAPIWGQVTIGALLLKRFGMLGAAGGALGLRRPAQQTGQQMGGWIGSGMTGEIEQAGGKGIGSALKRAGARALPFAKGVGVTLAVGGILGGVNQALSGGKAKRTVTEAFGDFDIGFFRTFGANIGETTAENLSSTLKDSLRRLASPTTDTIAGIRERIGVIWDDLSPKERQIARAANQASNLAVRIEKAFRIKRPPAEAILGDPKAARHWVQRFLQGLQFLRSGVATSMKQVLDVSDRNLAVIDKLYPQHGARWRNAVSNSLKETARAIAIEMAKSGKVTDDGLAHIRRLFAKARLIDPTDSDPLHIAKGFSRSWDNAGRITDKSVQLLIRKVGQMPEGFQRETGKAVIAAARALAAKRDVPAREVDKLVALLGKRFGVVEGRAGEAGSKASQSFGHGLGGMNRVTGTILGAVVGNVNRFLRSAGVTGKDINFSAAQLPSLWQRGGHIDLGAPSGDSVPALLERDEYVLNRHAVKAIGVEVLDRVNFSQAPRFQAGGAMKERLGRSRIAGPEPMRSGAQSGVDRDIKAANAYLDKWAHVIGGSNIVAVGHSMQREGYEVSEHPAFGGVTQGAHTSGSDHYSGHAIDVSDDVAPFKHGQPESVSLDWLASQVRKIPHRQIIWRNHDLDTGAYIPGHLDHLHFAMQRGGAVGRLWDRAKRFAIGGGVNINHSFAPHYSGQDDYGGPSLQPWLVAAIAEHYGLPGWTFARISGPPGNESGNRPGAVGNDARGSEGLGLWQITTSVGGPGNSDIINALGGKKAMLNPFKNAEGAKRVFDRQGFGAWVGHQTGDDHYDGDYNLKNSGLGDGGAGAADGDKGPTGPPEGYFPMPPPLPSASMPKTPKGCSEEIDRCRRLLGRAQAARVHVRQMPLQKTHAHAETHGEFGGSGGVGPSAGPVISGQYPVKKVTRETAIRAWAAYIKGLGTRIGQLVKHRAKLVRRLMRDRIHNYVDGFGEMPNWVKRINAFMDPNYGPLAVAAEKMAAFEEQEPSDLEVAPDVPETITDQKGLDTFLAPYKAKFSDWISSDLGFVRDLLGKSWEGRNLNVAGQEAATARIGVINLAIDAWRKTLRDERRKKKPNKRVISDALFWLKNWDTAKKHVKHLRGDTGEGWEANLIGDLQGITGERPWDHRYVKPREAPLFGGTGGRIFQTQEHLAEVLARTFDTPALGDISGGGDGGGGDGGGDSDAQAKAEALADLYKQIAEDAQRQVYTQNLQGPVAQEFPYYNPPPVMHEGGIFRAQQGGEGPAILKDKEGVFTPAQMKAMGGEGPPHEFHFHFDPASGEAWVEQIVDGKLRKVARAASGRGRSSMGRVTTFG